MNKRSNEQTNKRTNERTNEREAARKKSEGEYKLFPRIQRILIVQLRSAIVEPLSFSLRFSFLYTVELTILIAYKYNQFHHLRFVNRLPDARNSLTPLIMKKLLNEFFIGSCHLSLSLFNERVCCTLTLVDGCPFFDTCGKSYKFVRIDIDRHSQSFFKDTR
jgi:hypothetical protein